MRCLLLMFVLGFPLYGEGLDDPFGGLEIQSIPESATPTASVATESLQLLRQKIQTLKEAFSLAGYPIPTQVQSVSDSRSSTEEANIDGSATGLMERLDFLQGRFNKATDFLFLGGVTKASEIAADAIGQSLKKRELSLEDGSLSCSREDGVPAPQVKGHYLCSYRITNNTGSGESVRTRICINEDGEVVCHENVR